MEKKHIFIAFVTATLFLCGLTAYAKFFHFKEYEFYVEVACDPETTICFERNCDEAECPPNKLSHYSSYTISANDFALCQNNNCKNVCEKDDTSHLCEQIICDKSIDQCSQQLD
jgi:hypothetical protein